MTKIFLVLTVFWMAVYFLDKFFLNASIEERILDLVWATLVIGLANYFDK